MKIDNKIKFCLNSHAPYLGSTKAPIIKRILINLFFDELIDITVTLLKKFLLNIISKKFSLSFKYGFVLILSNLVI